MAPPPVTPSPHRFIVNKQRPLRTVQQQKPISSTPQFNNVPRFNATPRFTNPVQRPIQHGPSTTLNAATAPPRRNTPRFNATPRPTRLQETIEDELSGDEDLDDDVRQSIEVDDNRVRRLEDNRARRLDTNRVRRRDEDDIYEADDFPESVAKRRRLNSSPISDSDIPTTTQNDKDVGDDLDDFESLTSSLNEISSPLAPAPRQPRPQSKPVPRFLPYATPQPHSHSTIGTPSTPLTITKPFSNPPRFRLPSPTSQAGGGEPLPDAFSPRRRDEKYLVGGLANELRSWILNIGNEPASTSRHGFHNSTTNSLSNSTSTGSGLQNSKKSEWRFKILIDEISGGNGAGEAGMTLVRGRQIISQLPGAGNVPHSAEDEIVDSLSEINTKIVLAGSGIVDGLNRAKKVGVGVKIGVKGRTWDVLIKGVKWGVFCEWRVLS